VEKTGFVVLKPFKVSLSDAFRIGFVVRTVGPYDGASLPLQRKKIVPKTTEMGKNMDVASSHETLAPLRFQILDSVLMIEFDYPFTF
jgi:hypothetical protein